mmetsp:Transcript_50735/g.58171  ORF Transcript_50735/g.58171 Transcript_50735/m.58171 type:complete len:421 (+) Transcript_50735:111-1373(+)|eukprot:CAMPEP_0115020546 /NCGR_PEP_ID=MMETSP0216-20121206/30235_1 /TAXON_ID=223996 /ORGANISM="Protocruzia adherens, Strain Boccale" /LENGTH=420 /DNA_ID=CAMNT_0002392491 /DNA_START=61 /DNA_END=1323 /DNA_ORIENTATION=+
MKVMKKNFLKRGGRALFSTSIWDALPNPPTDPIFGVTEAFKKDTAENKVLLGVGAYRDDAGKPLVLDCVKEAKKRILEQGLDHEYSPMSGNPNFVESALKLGYGANSQALKDGRVVGLQSISGTGALRMAFEFFSHYYPHKNLPVLLPNPTWANHKNCITRANMEFEFYDYYDPSTRGFNFNGMLASLEKAPKHTIVLLHLCAHNPTGVDPTHEQWDEIRKVIKQKEHFVLFDNAYQAFATGDADHDAYSVRSFVADDVPLIMSQSFAKNFGLYGERIGCLSFFARDAEEAAKVKGHASFVARFMYSNPPINGARIVDTVIRDEELFALWDKEVKGMSGRMASMRTALKSGIENAGSTHNWQHIIDQIGMFAFTGLTPDQVDIVREKYHIYLTQDGRISISGLNTGNVEYVANAFHEVTK